MWILRQTSHVNATGPRDHGEGRFWPRCLHAFHALSPSPLIPVLSVARQGIVKQCPERGAAGAADPARRDSGYGPSGTCGVGRACQSNATASRAAATANDCLATPYDGCQRNPTQAWSDAFTASAAQPETGGDWDRFNAWAYAADRVVAILDPGQTEAWAPTKDRGTWGRVLWWARWVLAALGWIVTGLGVAAVTGVMQRNQPD